MNARRSIRALGLLLTGAALLAGSGCAQREPNNPFQGQSGAANEQPFGALPAALAPTAPRKG